MVKVFKIIEKVVYCVTALTIVAVLGMLILGAIANLHIDWARVFPLLYLVAAVCVLYKIVVISFSSFYQIQITRRKDLLDTLNPTDNQITAQLAGCGADVGCATGRGREDYNVLPKDSLVSKDGVEADLSVLRNKLVNKNNIDLHESGI